VYTVKKEREVLKGVGAKSYLTRSFLIFFMTNYSHIAHMLRNISSFPENSVLEF
jgi:hypothetical protein